MLRDLRRPSRCRLTEFRAEQQIIQKAMSVWGQSLSPLVCETDDRKHENDPSSVRHDQPRRVPHSGRDRPRQRKYFRRGPRHRTGRGRLPIEFRFVPGSGLKAAFSPVTGAITVNGGGNTNDRRQRFGPLGRALDAGQLSDRVVAVRAPTG